MGRGQDRNPTGLRGPAERENEPCKAESRAVHEPVRRCGETLRHESEHAGEAVQPVDGGERQDRHEDRQAEPGNRVHDGRTGHQAEEAGQHPGAVRHPQGAVRRTGPADAGSLQRPAGRPDRSGPAAGGHCKPGTGADRSADRRDLECAEPDADPDGHPFDGLRRRQPERTGKRLRAGGGAVRQGQRGSPESTLPGDDQRHPFHGDRPEEPELPDAADEQAAGRTGGADPGNSHL